MCPYSFLLVSNSRRERKKVAMQKKLTVLILLIGGVALLLVLVAMGFDADPEILKMGLDYDDLLLLEVDGGAELIDEAP